MLLYEPIRFAGGYLDTHQDGKGPKLYKFGERYYDPTLGRWTQQDPFSNPLDQQGWNLYDYAGDDPLSFTDPSGVCIVCSNPLGLVSAAKTVNRYVVHPVSTYLRRHEWARCALFAAGVVSIGGEAALAAREGVQAAREGASLGEGVSRVASGVGTKIGTAGAVGTIASWATGGCLP